MEEAKKKASLVSISKFIRDTSNSYKGYHITPLDKVIKGDTISMVLIGDVFEVGDIITPEDCCEEVQFEVINLDDKHSVNNSNRVLRDELYMVRTKALIDIYSDNLKELARHPYMINVE